MPRRARILIMGLALLTGGLSLAQAATIRMGPGAHLKAKLAQLRPGDTLLLQDGTYPRVEILCNAGAPQGRAGAPITLRAAHERQARLISNGEAEAFFMNGCSYWMIEGLYLESADNPNNILGREGILTIQYSNHITVRRTLGNHSNMRRNQTGYNASYAVSDILFEENEVYGFGNNGFGTYTTNSDSTNHIVLRRNYLNARNPQGAGPPNERTVGGAAVHYFGSNTINENNVSEKTGWVNLSGSNNKYYGNIVYNNSGNGFPMSRHAQYGSNPRGILLEHNVCVNCSNGGTNRSQEEYVNRHMTILGDNVGAAQTCAFYVDNKYDSRVPGLNCCSPDGSICPYQCPWHIEPTVTITDMLVGPGQGAGICLGHTETYASLTFHHNNVIGRTPNLPGLGSNNGSMDPKMGTCTAWIPEGSPLKGRASDGGDIGATILYRYQEGVLTQEPLWKQDGSFTGCGAIVPGVNDIVGDSCFDVHKRLNINQNGCPFPDGYRPADGTEPVRLPKF
jgi:Chondroitinase B